MVDLAVALASIGSSLADLQRSAEQVVVFGSRAAGLARAGSDWDVLAIGEGRRAHAPALDLVWVSPRDLRPGAWLDSELAGHVARWGRWLHGAPDWIDEVGGGVAAAGRKARLLASRVVALERAWRLLPPPYRHKHHTLLRRDLQRHAMLVRGEVVPPSRLLDETWAACRSTHAELLLHAQSAGVCSVFFEEELAGFAPDCPEDAA